jgi:hypothetical protein
MTSFIKQESEKGNRKRASKIKCNRRHKEQEVAKNACEELNEKLLNPKRSWMKSCEKKSDDLEAVLST